MLIRRLGRPVRLSCSTCLTMLAVAGVVNLAPAWAQDSVVLDTVVLQGASATENTGSYVSQIPSGTASGLPLTVRETPQSVSVITSQQMQDRGATVLNQVIDTTPGLTAMQGNGEFRWSFYARGSAVENQQFDGVANYVHFYSRDANPQEDMAIYDRVEVVRGATGLLEGTGSPSASVNLVHKMPTATRQSSVELEASSFGNARLTYDTSGPLSRDGRLRGRFVASGLAGDGQRDNLNIERQLFYGALEYDLTESTVLTAGLHHTKEKVDGYSWGGVWLRQDGSFYDFDGDTSPSLDWEYSDREQVVGFLYLTHQLDSGWTLAAKMRASDGNSDMFSSYMRYDEDDQLLRDGGRYEYLSQTTSLDLRATGQISAFGRQHDLVLGVNGSRDRTRYDGSSYYDIVIPDPGVAQPGGVPRPPFTPRDSYWDTVSKNYGIYGSARWSLADDVELITGARVAWYDYSDDAAWGPSAFSVDSQVVPYVGLVYDVNPTWTVYGSYTGIFAPKSNRGVNGQIDPVEGKNFEMGAKAALGDSGLIAAASVFQTDQDGLPLVDPDNRDCGGPGTDCYVNAELIRTRGLELELSGAVSDRWNISASYTYANAKFEEGPQAGTRYNTQYNPKHLAKLSTTYRLAGALEGLTLGGSVRYQSAILKDGRDGGDWASNYTPFYIKQGGFTVVDLMARYDLNDRSSVQLNVNNLFDKTYYTALDNVGYGNFIAAKRNATLTLVHKF